MKPKYIGKTCPYCRTPLAESDEIVVCSACDMPHHLSCWQENQGCTTFGCTGSIKEIVGEDTEAAIAPSAPQPTPTTVAAPKSVQAAPAKTAPAPEQIKQTEKPIETLYESKEIVFMSDVPIVLENTAIIIDRIKDKLFARCTFRSITDKAIKAVLIEISCQDIWGSTLGNPVSFQYLDLKTARDSCFGQNTPIELVDKTARRLQVVVKKLMFADGTLVDAGATMSTIPTPVPLNRYLGSIELAEEYARETVPSAQFAPVFAEGLWRCACGSLNTSGEEKCYNCGCTKEQLTAALNPEALNANMVRFAEAKRAAAERAQAEQAERIRLAEEQVRLEQERKEQQFKMAENLERKKKRRKKTVTTIVVSLVVVALLGCGVVFFGIPYFNYQEACNALVNGEYDVAHQAFVELGGFLDSEDMANESLYRKAEAALKDKQYDSAIQLFTDLGGYEDSEDKALAAKYEKGMNLMASKQYDPAYKVFKELGDYKDADDKLAECIYSWADYVLSKGKKTLAEKFKTTVSLQSEHYSTIYSKIWSQINNHPDFDYWDDYWNDTEQATVVYTMLQMLPSSYGDTSALNKLFKVLSNGDIHPVADYIRDNKTFLKSLWSIDFIQDFLQSDDMITYFLEDYWTTYNGDYYLNFYENDDGNTTCSYNLPWVAQPAGTKYYDIENLILYWDGDNNNHLAKVYRFEIVDFDTIKVYCYKDNKTYTLYR